MLHVWYVISFWFDSHLGDVPFFLFFKTCHSVRLGVKFRLDLGLALGLALGLLLG